MSTPLCFFTSLLSISFACIVYIVFSVFCYFIFYNIKKIELFTLKTPLLVFCNSI